MKFLSLSIVIILIIARTTQVQANDLLKITKNSPIERVDGTRIETIGVHAFFILSLEKSNINIGHGDKVELIFGLNNKVTVYNVSSKNNNDFLNENELVVFISPEDLRCFKKKKLRKVKIYTSNEPVVIKTNIGPDQLKIKE